MKKVDPERMKRLRELKDIILKLTGSIANDIPDYNYKSKELYDELLGDDTKILNGHIEEFNTLRNAIVEEQEAFLEGCEPYWRDTEDGERYDAWKDEWCCELDEFELEAFEEIEEPTLLDETDFDKYSQSPGDIEFPEPVAAAAAPVRTAEDWKVAVVAGKTELSLKEWLEE